MKSLHLWAVTALLVSALSCASTVAGAIYIDDITDPGAIAGTHRHSFGVDNSHPVVDFSDTAGSSTVRTPRPAKDSPHGLNNHLPTDAVRPLTKAASLCASERTVWRVKRATFRILPTWLPPPL